MNRTDHIAGLDGSMIDAPPAAPIAIIGISGRYPGAGSVQELWRNLCDGVDAVGEARGDRWDFGLYHPDEDRPRRVYTRAGGFLDRVDLFDAEFFGISPREARQVDPQHRLLLELAWETFEDSGLVPKAMAGTRTGVFVGISGNDYANLEGEGSPDAYSNTGVSLSIASNRVSYIFDLHGPSMSIDTACSSGLVCVHQACVSLAAGECDTALVGAVNMLISVRPWVGFAKASMLSRVGRCQSFDAAGDGYVRSEGGGMLLLKPLSAALRDSDSILGTIIGTGVNSDGRTMGLSMPNVEAQAALLGSVYRRCGIAPEEVFYVEAHGTGTSVGDPIECESIGRVLGASRKDGSRLRIGSIKSNIGHLEPASGIAGLTKALLALRHRTIPANLHFNTPNPRILFDEWKLDVVAAPVALPERAEGVVLGVNSFGFGGTNAHVVLREYRPQGAAATTVPRLDPEVLMLSGQTPAAVAALAESYVPFLQGIDPPAWPAVCATAACGRGLHAHRLVLSATTPDEAAERLAAHLSGSTPSRLAVGRAASEQVPVAFVYSGNGPQWWGMARELLAASPLFAAEIAAVDDIFAPLAGWSLREEMQRPERESRIALTEVAQPLLFAQQVGLTALLREAGIVPAAAFGHSVGEVAAAFASGALSLAQATRVIVHRSTMQARTAGHGRMAALGISADEAEAAMASIGGWLEIAAINAPRAVTVAGDPRALSRLTAMLTEAGKFARLLPLDYPFHTRAMDPIRDGLIERLADLQGTEGRIPFVSTVEGTAITGAALGPEYWWRNVRAPVRFADAVEHVLSEGLARAFIEIGPHPVLRDYVQQAIKARGGAEPALATLRRPAEGRPESDIENIATAICAAHAHGAGDLRSLYVRPSPPVPLPSYPWQRTTHWRGSNPLPEIFTPIRRDHPLLGYRLPAKDGLWQGSLDTVLLPYLADHVVQGSVLFPAAGHIELGLAAGRMIHGDVPIELEGLDILRPLVIPPQSDPQIQLMMDVADGSFTVRGRADRETVEWTDHLRGRISKADHARPPADIDLPALRAAFPIVVDSAAHYAGSVSRGLAYGPAFQGVRNIALSPIASGPRRALGDILLEGLEVAEYAAHPALLDSCLQVLITLIGQAEQRRCATIPVQVGRLRSFAPLTPHIVCLAELRRESERSGVADFTICSPDGAVLLTITGARFQKVDFNAALTPINTEWWRPDPAFGEPHADLPLHPPIDIAAEVERIVATHAQARFDDEIRPAMDRLAGAYAAAALAEIGGRTPFTLRSLARRGDVDPEQDALLARLVAMAEADGAVTRTDQGWSWAASRPEAPEPGALWHDLVHAYPGYSAEWQALLRAGEALPAMLRDGPAERTDALGDSAPTSAAGIAMTQAALSAIVAAWPAGRLLRILEIGGGVGSLTAALLPALPLHRADYLFTDPSEAAVARAKHRFAGQKVLHTAVLDLAQPDVASSLGAFDLVVAQHALHRAEDPETMLSRLAALLAPGGRIALIEPHACRFADLVLGGTPRTGEAWQHALSATGFTDARAYPDAPAANDALQSLLVASHPGVSRGAIAPAAAFPAARWALLIGPGEAGTPLVAAVSARLEESGQHVSVFDIAADGTLSEAFAARLASPLPPQEIVHLAGLAGGPDPLALQDQRCLGALRIVQAIAQSGSDVEPLIDFVTGGGLASADGGGPADPAQAALWGIGRVLANEHPTLGCRLIDLRATLDDAAAGRLLADALLLRDGETELLLQDGRRFVHRVRPTSLAEQATLGGTPMPPSWRLDFTPGAGLDSLHLREASRRAPAAGEVEIAVRAAGLNFRDVLWAMGMLPEEAVEQGFSGPTIGMECAGTVLRMGDHVSGIAVGDKVIGFASSCFASHVTTDAGSVARMPEGLDFAEAATIPTAFLTAWYALVELARVRPGETILVHGAAGGVGLAALQIGMLLGAHVIGSAGSPEKRRIATLLGADHVVNSRALDFADDLMRLTDGRGVDVVLNSLAGEAITKGLQVLRPFGRFLEIGKRDLYANSRVGLRPFRNNLSYFGIDADTLLIDRPELARDCFAAVMAKFATGALHPLPHLTVPLSRAGEAFRAMQQSRHIGKLVVTIGEGDAAQAVVRSAPNVRADGTYLVTGGLSGFGLATAHWLAGQGARSFALVGRRGATTEEALAGIAALEALGARVTPFAVDIADPAQVETMLAGIRASMPPLVGVFHAAAVIEDAPILQIDAERLRRVLAPKLMGAWNLHNATLTDKLEMFVLYSSSSVLVGNPGQASYVAANLYLDSLARFRRAQGKPALSIGFGAIKDAGFLTRNAAVEEMLRTRTGMDATPAADALADMGRLLAAGATCATVAQFNLARLGQSLSSARAPRFRPLVPDDLGTLAGAAGTMAAALEAMDDTERRATLLDLARAHVGRVLGTGAQQVDVERPLSEMGLDSLMAVELAEGLEQEIGRPVSVMQMIQAGNVTAISAAIARGFAADTPVVEPLRLAAE